MPEERPPWVLLVEDNEVNQAVAIAILARLGYRADVAGDGQQAVDLVVRGHYGLVLMDCQLPVMNGYQATAEIRRREGIAHRTPIIAMTAGVLEDRQRCLSAGMDDHIAKPVLLTEVQMVLSRWLAAEVTTPKAAGPTAAAELPWEVLDQNRLTELGGLHAIGNGAALVGELIECFVVGIPVDLADLRAAVHHRDAVGVARIAHRLRGAAGTIGSSGMASLCEQLEVRARTGALPVAGDLLALLEQEFDRVIRALKAVVPGHGVEERTAHRPPSTPGMAGR
ncbi:MAG: hybrid signal transduction histidine kinase [Actinomycetia bacterium]|nr:hybrid signal transduction histidine kinase [Actinomycetes bacterium]